MPKIISVTKETILNITKNIISCGEFDKLNCSLIAKEAGIAVGTIYRFFKSKDEIVAYVILNDWIDQLNNVNTNTSIDEGIENLYNALKAFSTKYYDLFMYTKSTQSEYVSYLDKHSLLVEQIKGLIVDLFSYNNIKKEEIEIEFLAESILSYSTRLYEYSRMKKIFIKLIGGCNNG